MSWTEAKGTITGYRVHCLERRSGFDHFSHVGGRELSHVIQDLKPGAEYTISVIGLNGKIESQPMPVGGLFIETKFNQSMLAEKLIQETAMGMIIKNSLEYMLSLMLAFVICHKSILSKFIRKIQAVQAFPTKLCFLTLGHWDTGTN